MPLAFCPNCSNVLTISRLPGNDKMPAGVNRYECRICPYQWILTREIYELTTIKRKEVEDVLGGKGSWDNVDQMPAQCANDQCEGDRAFFYQLQIRSADEPMTRFLKCVTCGIEWREN